MIRRVFYGPRDWLSEHTNSRDRGALAFWLLVFVLGPLNVLTYPVRDSVAVLWAISMGALALALLAVLFAETPVEVEADTAHVEHADEVSTGDGTLDTSTEEES